VLNLKPVYCTRCKVPVAWTDNMPSPNTLICNLCVQDEWTLLRWLKRVPGLFAHSLTNKQRLKVRIIASNNVTQNLNNFNVAKRDANYKHVICKQMPVE